MSSLATKARSSWRSGPVRARPRRSSFVACRSSLSRCSRCLRDGTPSIIVADADSIHNAIDRVFPRLGGDMPEVRLCEWHIKSLLVEKISHLGSGHRVAMALDLALISTRQWEFFLAAVETQERLDARSVLLVRNWVTTYGDRVAAQVATRRVGSPHSTSSVEAVLRTIGTRIGPRVGSFTNRRRMRNLLSLMLLDIRGQANGRVWADLLREHLYLAGGTAPRQREHDDPRRAYSLLA